MLCHALLLRCVFMVFYIEPGPEPEPEPGPEPGPEPEPECKCGSAKEPHLNGEVVFVQLLQQAFLLGWEVKVKLWNGVAVGADEGGEGLGEGGPGVGGEEGGGQA